MSSGGAARSFTDLFSRRGPRGPESQGSGPTPAVDAAPVFGTKALRKFVASLAQRENPVLLDLGPVIGSNVTFFGEQLGCKIFVEDIFADLDRHLQSGKEEGLAEYLSRRFTQPDKCFDGILCWDLVDFLEKPAAQVVARQMIRLLKDEGTLLAFFGTTAVPDPRYTKYIIVDEGNLKHRSNSSRKRKFVWTNRDINIMFEGLRVAESFLLQHNIREILFRKPAGTSPDAKA